MHVIIGGTGHIGSAAAKALLAHGEPVTIVSRSADRADDWKARGAAVAVADIHDKPALRAAIDRGRRLLVVNPPADPRGDFDKEESRTIAAILGALDGADLDRVLAVSTYGAQSGEAIGDLGTLFGFEQGLEKLPLPVRIHRGAYYMSNLDTLLEPVRQDGVLPSIFPAEFVLPMVAPQDLGKAAASALAADSFEPGLYFVEGPAPQSMQDAADAFAEALGRPVKVVTTPRDELEESYRKLGFSEPSARSFAGMAKASLDGVAFPDDPIRGETTLRDYVRDLVNRAS